MKLLKKIAACSLLTLGFICVASGIYAPFNLSISQKERESELVACLAFGLPLTAGGGLIAWNLHRRYQREADEFLRSVFFRLLKERDGRLTLSRFAMEAQLTGEAAKQYLDEQAKKFDANFDVDEQGGVYYDFNMGDSVRDRLP